MSKQSSTNDAAELMKELEALITLASASDAVPKNLRLKKTVYKQLLDREVDSFLDDICDEIHDNGIILMPDTVYEQVIEEEGKYGTVKGIIKFELKYNYNKSKKVKK